MMEASEETNKIADIMTTEREDPSTAKITEREDPSTAKTTEREDPSTAKTTGKKRTRKSTDRDKVTSGSQDLHGPSKKKSKRETAKESKTDEPINNSSGAGDSTSDKVEDLHKQVLAMQKEIKEMSKSMLAIQTILAENAGHQQQASTSSTTTTTTSSSNTAVRATATRKRGTAGKSLAEPHTRGHSEEQQKIEIVEGYGVYCTKLQLENAVTSATNPTKLIRNLLGIFFSKDELAESTALGTRGSRKALDQTVLPACMRYVLNLYPNATKTVLIDSINDKCANYRRKKK